MKVAKLIVLFLGFLILFSFKNEQKRAEANDFLIIDTFPVPPMNEKFLFYVQRTPNTNTIMYELNTQNDGSINKEDPIHIFWIRYKEDGSRSELSYLQRKYGYGLKWSITDQEKLAYKLHFVSYSKRYLFLQRSMHDKKYHIYTYISGKWSILQRVFIKIEGGSFWIPNVKQVEMYGKESASGKSISEIFKP